MNARMALLRGRGRLPQAPARGVLARLVRHRGGQLGLVLMGMIIAAVLVGPLVLQRSPEAFDPGMQLAGPSRAHPFGTDQFGRDELARVLDGGRRTLLAAWTVIVLSLAIGVGVGMVAGVAGGLLDSAIMRLADILMAFPGLVLALILIAILGPGGTSLVLALAATLSPTYVRLARSYVLGWRTRLDVLSARLAGLGWARIAVGHLLPAAASHVLVVAALDLGLVITLTSGLSLIGLGVQAPTPEWGTMLADSRLFLADAPWLLVAPGAAIMLSIWTANLIGEALQAAADPRRRA